jgi:hypothetical protein
VVSVRVFENDTLTDNTGSGGLPKLSIEVVVFGGVGVEIAQTLFDTVAATERLYSGAHGTTKSFTIESELLVDDEIIKFSRPPEKGVDLTLDLVVDASYVGNQAIKGIIADYIGGKTPDGSISPGIGIGVDVRVDAIRDRVVGPDTGVRGVASVSATPATTTNAEGLTVIDVGADEVPRTDATDGSITLNLTEV